MQASKGIEKSATGLALTGTFFTAKAAQPALVVAESFTGKIPEAGNIKEGLVAVEVSLPNSHKKVALPKGTVAFKKDVAPPLQMVSNVKSTSGATPIMFTSIVSDTTQPVALVTVTEYLPEALNIAKGVVSLVDHK